MFSLGVLQLVQMQYIFKQNNRALLGIQNPPTFCALILLACLLFPGCGEDKPPSDADPSDTPSDTQPLSPDTSTSTATTQHPDTSPDALPTDDAPTDTLPPTDTGPCLAEAPTACPSPAPTYAADIAPIFQAQCVTCHSGLSADAWPLTTRSHIADWQNEVRAELLSCSMPPPNSGSTLTDRERQTILEWLRCGLPE